MIRRMDKPYPRNPRFFLGGEPSPRQESVRCTCCLRLHRCTCSCLLFMFVCICVSAACRFPAASTCSPEKAGLDWESGISRGIVPCSLTCAHCTCEKSPRHQFGAWSRKMHPSVGTEVLLFTLLDLCVSSFCSGHANILCIVPMLIDDPLRKSRNWSSPPGIRPGPTPLT